MSDQFFSNLSFSTESDPWTLVSSGHWDADCAAGRAAATELLQAMTFHDAPFALGYVLQRMVERGVWGGCEVGFAHKVAECACVGITD